MMVRKYLSMMVAVILIALAVVLAYSYYPISPVPQRTVEIEVVARQWFFDAMLVSSTDPNARVTTILLPGSLANTTIVVTKGDLVIIHFRTADVPHGFVITGYPQVGPYEVVPGQTVTFDFLATREGAFTFHCTVFCGPGHPNHKGTLIVLP